MGPKEEALRAPDATEGSPEPATWRDWFAFGATWLGVFFGASAVALLLAILVARIIPPLM